MNRHMEEGKELTLTGVAFRLVGLGMFYGVIGLGIAVAIDGDVALGGMGVLWGVGGFVFWGKGFIVDLLNDSKGWAPPVNLTGDHLVTERMKEGRRASSEPTARYAYMVSFVQTEGEKSFQIPGIVDVDWDVRDEEDLAILLRLLADDLETGKVSFHLSVSQVETGVEP